MIAVGQTWRFCMDLQVKSLEPAGAFVEFRETESLTRQFYIGAKLLAEKGELVVPPYEPKHGDVVWFDKKIDVVKAIDRRSVRLQNLGVWVDPTKLELYDRVEYVDPSQ